MLGASSSMRYPLIRKLMVRNKCNYFCQAQPKPHLKPNWGLIGISLSLLTCESLMPARLQVLNYWDSFSSEDDQLRTLLISKLRSPIAILMQFLIDPSTDHHVIQGVQQKLLKIDEVYRLTRTWCYAVHRKKLQLTGRFRKFKVVFVFCTYNIY